MKAAAAMSMCWRTVRPSSAACAWGRRACPRSRCWTGSSPASGSSSRAPRPSTAPSASLSVNDCFARRKQMLKMQALSKVYRAEMVETYALREFNLNVKEGEFVAVTGPSGSGKTTFLTIAGLLEAFSGGSYLLDGVDVSAMNDTQRSRMHNEKIG